MNVGDLVIFSIKNKEIAGALTAVKYYARIQRIVGKEVGLVISSSGDNCLVAFGENHVVLHRKHLEVVSESR